MNSKKFLLLVNAWILNMKLFKLRTYLFLSFILPTVAFAQAEMGQVIAKLETIPEIRFLNAQIEAVRKATVASQVRGRIIEIPFDVDDYVEKGVVLVRFRDREQRAAVKSAKAQFDEAESEFKRTKEIYAKRLIAKSVLDKAEARIKSARALLEQANESLANTIVRAPYSGIVVKRHVEVGELAKIGQKLMTGLSLETLRATVQLPQSIIHQVRKFKQAKVYLGKNRNKLIEATSMSISPYADPTSHTFTARLHLPTAEHNVYPGMHTRASVTIGERTALLIPENAVSYRGEVTAVYVKKKNSKIEFRQIRLGRRTNENNMSKKDKIEKNNSIEVLAGLSEGEVVLLDPVRAASLIQQQNRNAQ